MPQSNTIKTISLSNQVTDNAVYNLWANQTLVEWLKTKPEETLAHCVPSSFSSIRDTLTHIWDVERIWLGHLKQKPVVSYRVQPFEGALCEVFEGLIKQSEDVMDYAWSLTDETINEGCHFSSKFLGDHTMPRAEVLQHMLNHSTYHRGQVVTIARNVGLTDPPMTDYMFYLFKVKNKA